MRRFISIILLSLVFSAEFLSAAEGGLQKFLDSYEKKYLQDSSLGIKGEKVQMIKGAGVIWVGKKNGLQPVSPYVCVAFYKLGGGGQVLVVDDVDYKKLTMLWGSIGKTEKIKRNGYYYRMVTFGEFMKEQDASKFSKSWTPSSKTLVCIRESLRKNANN